MQTEQLRAALQNTASALRKGSTPHAALIVDELEAMCTALTSPPESYIGLDELDKAVTSALIHLEDLSSYAAQGEIQQTMKTLRRIVLVSRASSDPDSERHKRFIAITIRQLWLIGHRAGLLKANTQLMQISQALNANHISTEERARHQEALDLLTQYINAQEGYGASVRQELDELNTNFLF